MLFNVQDSERPMFVLASDWYEALDKWRAMMREENDIPPDEPVDGPNGIQFVADDDEIIL